MMNPGDGAITCVRLFTPPGASRPTHLLSGSDDGSIAIWQAGGDWEALKLLRGHKVRAEGGCHCGIEEVGWVGWVGWAGE